MTEPERDRRRPLPALVFILALTILTALVWWRVLHRGDSQASDKPTAASGCPTAVPSSGPSGRAASASVGRPTSPRVPERPHTLPPPSAVHVQVLNATDRVGLAGRTTRALKKDGFQTAKAANDESNYRGAGVGQIRYAPAAKGAARLVRFFVPGAKLVPVQGRSTTVILALGEKFTGLRPHDKVTAHLHREHITLNRRAAPRSATPSPTPTC